MPEITPSFTMRFENRMRSITETEYQRRLAAKNVWWNRVLRNTPMEGRNERVAWLLETAMIEPVGPSGTGVIEFENLVTQTTELTSWRHAKGIRIQRDQLEDIDGVGLNEAQGWSSQVGNEIAYYPQRLAAQAILNGAATDGSANAYDTVPFFADNTSRTLAGNSVKGHPYNPFNTAAGGYQNWLHGSSSGAYPGALPIDDSVSVDTALVNLGKALAHIKANKMPNGVDPRYLEVAYILCPSKMMPRVTQLMNAKYIAQAAASLGAGSADVQALISYLGYGQPVEAQELNASQSYTFDMPFVNSSGNPASINETVTGSDTTWYVVTEQAASSTLGSLLLMNRKPFKVTYYYGDDGSGPNQVALDRMNQLEYHVQGRQAVQYGHPYGIYRFDAT